MKAIKLLTLLALAAVVLVAGCKKSKTPADVPVQPKPFVVPLQTTQQLVVSVGGASGLVILAGAAINNTGPTAVTGDIALSPGTAVTGFPPGTLTGKQHINDAIASQAKLDLTEAYNNAAARTCADMVTLPGDLGGLTLTPGLYKSTSALAISSGDLIFDAKGSGGAVFIIQVAATLGIASDRKIILNGGAEAANIFWQVSDAVTLESGSAFKGTILAAGSITFNTGATLDGRTLTKNGTVNMSGNTLVLQ